MVCLFSYEDADEGLDLRRFYRRGSRSRVEVPKKNECDVSSITRHHTIFASIYYHRLPPAIKITRTVNVKSNEETDFLRSIGLF
jgi:hypothetical protein